jgi:hypothetical protein
MYQADYLEVLWILKREKVKSPRINKALRLLKNRVKPDWTWDIERPISNLIIPITKRNHGNAFITRRAKEVMDFYKP